MNDEPGNRIDTNRSEGDMQVQSDSDSERAEKIREFKALINVIVEDSHEERNIYYDDDEEERLRKEYR
jgi:hypothetical protein